MKATTIIIAAILSLQAGNLFAGNEISSAPVTNESVTLTLAALAPVTPLEATFEEIPEMNEVSFLAPVSPAEATFEDMPCEPDLIVDFAPTTPSVADFEEAIDEIINATSLAPVTPAEADFE
ncbi:MAG: hypothetical protein NTW16_16190 [Bacteroidetes bacterium]|nr:hypothetical protein [Bacteroidota bacterium]